MLDPDTRFAGLMYTCSVCYTMKHPNISFRKCMLQISDDSIMKAIPISVIYMYVDVYIYVYLEEKLSTY